MHRILKVVGVACLWSIVGSASAQPDSRPRPAATFTDLGLAGFEGEGSIAAALRRAGAGGAEPADNPQILPGLELRGLSIQGPSGRDIQSPIAAEVRSRIDRFDVAAGVRAEPDRVMEGPSQWVGRIGLANDRPEGSERLELRTTLGRRSDGGMLGVEVGPRLERRLRRGATFFIDGKAEARGLRSQDSSWWALPGTSTADGMVGVTARTGLVR